MKIAHIVTVLAIVVIFVASASVSMAIWTARQNNMYHQRTSLAHTSYEQHLQLTADRFLLFRRFGDVLLAGDTEPAHEAGDITMRLNTHLANIRQTIEEKIRVFGQVEVRELELLVEDVIEELATLFERTLVRDDLKDIRAEWRGLSEVSLVFKEMSEVVSANTKTLIAQYEVLEESVGQSTVSLEKLLGDARKSEENRRQLLADFRHSNTSKRYAEGLGLGLPIVRLIADAHGRWGEDKRQSELGDNCCFDTPQFDRGLGVWL